MTFKPGDHAPRGGGGGGGKYLDTAGRFVLVFTHYVKRGETGGGYPFLLFRGSVVGGQPDGNEGKLITERVFIHPEAHARLGAMCAAMALDAEVELKMDDDKTNDDGNDVLGVRSAFLGRPFAAKVKVETNDGSKYAKIAYSEPEPTADEIKMIDAWTTKAEADGYYENLAKHSGDPTEGNKPPAHTDDDIPF